MSRSLIKWKRRAKDPEVKTENGENDMGIKIKKNSRPEGSICEQFVYTSHLVAYPNSSDMNELSEMRLGGLSIYLKGWYQL